MHKHIFELIEKEKQRQTQHVELIASENFVSEEILQATGSILTNKYAEGYPNKRYYGGCEVVDEIEQLAIDYAKQLFGAEHANVQPHSGSQANSAVYLACLKPGDTVLGMDLGAGGHLTHGAAVNFSGKLYNFVSYGIDPVTQAIDYEAVLKQAQVVNPKLIVAGASAYSLAIDFKKFREIADAVGALLLVDMAHIAGLVASGFHQSPVPYADFVTSTTHKTLRGPRSGLILCKQEWASKIDKAVFPGSQGGPLEHVIAAKALCFLEALHPSYRDYIQQVVTNMQAFVKRMKELGYILVSGRSENHLILVDVYQSAQKSGQEVEIALGKANITLNKNSIYQDPLGVVKASGIRVGSAAMTTRGFKEKEFIQVANWIDEVIKNIENPQVIEKVKQEVIALCSQYELVRKGSY